MPSEQFPSTTLDRGRSAQEPRNRRLAMRASSAVAENTMRSLVSEQIGMWILGVPSESADDLVERLRQAAPGAPMDPHDFLQACEEVSARILRRESVSSDMPVEQLIEQKAIELGVQGVSLSEGHNGDDDIFAVLYASDTPPRAGSTLDVLRDLVESCSFVALVSCPRVDRREARVDRRAYWCLGGAVLAAAVASGLLFARPWQSVELNGPPTEPATLPVSSDVEVFFWRPVSGPWAIHEIEQDPKPIRTRKAEGARGFEAKNGQASGTNRPSAALPPSIPAPITNPQEQPRTPVRKVTADL